MESLLNLPTSSDIFEEKCLRPFNRNWFWTFSRYCLLPMILFWGNYLRQWVQIGSGWLVDHLLSPRTMRRALVPPNNVTAKQWFPNGHSYSSATAICESQPQRYSLRDMIAQTNHGEIQKCLSLTIAIPRCLGFPMSWLEGTSASRTYKTKWVLRSHRTLFYWERLGDILLYRRLLTL